MTYKALLEKFDYSGASLDRIDVCINMMEAVDNANFNMTIWQQDSANSVCRSLEELHKCGSTACFGGYLALTPEFQAAGGRAFIDGQPLLTRAGGSTAYGGDAFNHFVGVPQIGVCIEDSLGDLLMATANCILIYGYGCSITPIDVVERLQYVRKLIVSGHNGEEA